MIKKILCKVYEKIIEKKEIIKKVLITAAVGIGIATTAVFMTNSPPIQSFTSRPAIVQTFSSNVEKVVETPKKKEFVGGLVGDLLDKGKEIVSESAEDVKENIEQQLAEKIMDRKLGWFQKKLFNGLSGFVESLFDFIYRTIIYTPQEMVTNHSVTKMYAAMTVLSIMLMAILTVFNQLQNIINGEDSGYSLSMVMWTLLKNVTYMFGFAYVFPKTIMFVNKLSECLLKLGFKQVEFNMLLKMLGGAENPGIFGFMLSLVILIALGIFFILIFLFACARYWDICQLFITAPPAFASISTPKTSGIFYTWKNNLKQTLTVQAVYAIHFALFAVITAIPFKDQGIRTMLMIGGIYKLVKVPGNIKSMFQRSNTEGNILKPVKKLVGNFTKFTE